MIEHAEHSSAARAFCLAAAMAALLLGGCAVTRDTQPPRTATEEMLISAAADRAADALRPHFAPGAKVFVDAQYFDGTDAKYTIGAIRDRLAQNGARLVADRKSADMVVEIRSGAQSIDQNSLLIGLPSINVPIPWPARFKHRKSHSSSARKRSASRRSRRPAMAGKTASTR